LPRREVDILVLIEVLAVALGRDVIMPGRNIAIEHAAVGDSPEIAAVHVNIREIEALGGFPVSVEPDPGLARRKDVNEYLPKFKQMAAEARRSPDALPITLFGGTEDADLLKRYRDMGVERVVTTLPPEPAEKTLPVLDRWAELIRHVNASG
jgi:hypothetical protein